MLEKHIESRNEERKLRDELLVKVEKEERTADIKYGADKIISTQEMGDAVIEELKILSGN